MLQLLLPLHLFLLGIAACETVDVDEDGWSESEGDCDDTDPLTHPDADELCDGKDNDCNATVDEGFTLSTFYPDQDGDGYGATEGSLEACAAPEGYVGQGGDCNDRDPTTHPDLEETCDDKDNNCDGELEIPVWFLDEDDDGYGNDAQSTAACFQPRNHSDVGGDCDDSNSSVHPGATDGCNGVDNDCNGEIDNGFVMLSYYPDLDGDHYGDPQGPVVACACPDGYMTIAGDCDDQVASSYPGALETCDGVDNDCDGTPDNDPDLAFYPDADGDGFGRQEAPLHTCDAPEGYAAGGHDCDDTDPAIYPGASDPTGDGRDQDCGGLDGLQPSVGLTLSSFTSLQAALDAAEEGSTVWVGPGTWLEHALTFRGKAVRLASSHGLVRTVVNAEYDGPVFVFNSGEGSGTVLEGLTLTKGYAYYGAGVEMRASSPTLRGCRVTSCVGGSGGGLYLNEADPVLEGCRVDGNRALEYDGAGLFMVNSSPTLRGCEIVGNRSELDDYSVQVRQGGGIFIHHSSPTLEDCTIAENLVTSGAYASADDGYAYGAGVSMLYSSPIFRRCRLIHNRLESFATGYSYAFGGGVYMYDSSPEFEGCRFEQNVAYAHWSLPRAFGGGLAAHDSAPVLRNCVVTQNRVEGMGNPAVHGGGLYLNESEGIFTNLYIAENMADGSSNTSYQQGASAGGGLLCIASELELSNVIISHNIARGHSSRGGGMYSWDSVSQIRNCTIVMNEVIGPYAAEGGGVYFTDGTALMGSNIIAFNTEDNLAQGYDAVSQTLTYTDLYNPPGQPNHDLPSLDSSNLTVEPGFLKYLEGFPVDLHLAIDSPLVNAGEPATLDRDSSRSDMGCYGGPGGATWDLDQDGWPDWFWPGTLANAPEGFDPADFDADDSKPDLH